MKFTVSAGEFADALRSVQGRAKGMTSLPILKHVLVTTDFVKVSLLGTDLDASSVASVDAEIVLAGSCAIPADPLSRIVSALPKAAHIEVAQVPGGLNVRLKSGRSRYSIPVMPAADFPPALTAKDGFKFEATAEDLEQLISRPSGFVAGKARRELSGVFIHDEGGKLVSVGTDGHSLVRFGTQIPSDGLERAVEPGHHGWIVPDYSLAEIIKIGAGTVSITQRTIEITAGARSYCSKLVDATFPEQYRRVIPDTAGMARIEIDRDEILESLSRLASIGAFSDCKLIDVTVNDDEIAVTLTGLAEGSETIECETEGANGKFFCLRTDQMLDACKAFKGGKIHIFVRGENEAIRLVDPSEPDAINVQVLCISKNRKAAAVAA